MNAGKTTTPGAQTISVGGSGAGASDYASDIMNDPAFKMLQQSLSAAGISDAAHLRGAIQQALIGFGAVPDLPQDILQNSGLDTAGTADLAANNPFSTLKRLQQTYQDQQDAAKNQLAARGILNSGETGFQLGRIGQNQAGAQYDATNNLLGGIGSLNDQYVQGRQAAANQLAQGAFSAEGNAAAAGGSGGGGPSVTATWDPATGTYIDPSGNHYGADGSPITLPTPTQPAGSFSGAAQGGLAATAPIAPVSSYDPNLLQRAGVTNQGF